MKKHFLFVFLFSFLLLAACEEKKVEPEAPKPVPLTKEQIIQEKRSIAYRQLLLLKDDVMNGNLDSWRARLDAFWVNGDIIDGLMMNYMNEIKLIALQKEKEMQTEANDAPLNEEPEINANYPVTKEILEIYLREVLSGIENGKLKNWQTFLDKAYLYGSELGESHYEIISQIEAKGAELNEKLKGKQEPDKAQKR